MAKPPPIEYFEVIAKVPKPLLGEVVGDFNKRGLTEVTFNLVTSVASYKGNNRTSHDIVAQDYLRTWIADHPTFRIKEAVAHFKADGRTPGACYTAARVLVADKTLRKLDEGQYQRTDVKALPAPSGKKTRQSKGPPKRFDKRGEDVILSYAKRNHGRFNTAKLVEVFMAEGRARNSLYASIDGLMKNKLVKRVGDAGSGQYVLLAKAVSKPKSKPKKTPPKKAANGHDVVTVEALSEA